MCTVGQEHKIIVRKRLEDQVLQLSMAKVMTIDDVICVNMVAVRAEYIGKVTIARPALEQEQDAQRASCITLKSSGTVPARQLMLGNQRNGKVGRFNIFDGGIGGDGFADGEALLAPL